MKNSRFTHSSICLFDKIYVIGGRGYEICQQDEEEIQKDEQYIGFYSTIVLLSCERYDITKNKWEQIAYLNIPRQTFESILYRDKIYVIGGASYNSRIQQIEQYNEQNNIWEILSFSLKEGVEAFSSCWISDSEFVIFGGQYDRSNIEFEQEEEPEYENRKIYSKIQIINFKQEFTTINSSSFYFPQTDRYNSNQILNSGQFQNGKNLYQNKRFQNNLCLSKYAYYQDQLTIIPGNSMNFSSKNEKQLNNISSQYQKCLMKFSISPPMYKCEQIIPFGQEQYEDLSPYPFSQNI